MVDKDWLDEGDRKQAEDLAVALYQQVADWRRSSPLDEAAKKKLLSVAVGAFASAFMRNILDAEGRQKFSDVIASSVNAADAAEH
jgi:hypothetical protein